MNKNEKNTKPIIALSGGFDPPTKVHIAMIQDASRIGKVVIILNTDKWCGKKRWNGKAFLSFKKRKKILSAMSDVHDVVKADDNDGTVCKTLRTLSPDFFGNGGYRNIENTPEVKVCKEMNIGMIWFLGKDVDEYLDENILSEAIRSANE